MLNGCPIHATRARAGRDTRGRGAARGGRGAGAARGSVNHALYCFICLIGHMIFVGESKFIVKT